MLEVRSLVKRFGRQVAVQGVSFRVERGESFGLLGPNGAGKSTIIGLITGLLTPDEGEVLIGGQDVRRSPAAVRQMLGFVPQEVALYPTLSALENLRFWGALYGLRGPELARRCQEALEIVALTERQRDRIETYSGGMKRRINIAAALLHRPQLLIMDEPTVGIDPQSRSHILETVKRLNAGGMTVLYTSHYMEEVEYLCQRVAIVDHGRVIAMGTLPEVRSLAGSRTTVRLRVAGAAGPLAAALAEVPGVEQVRQEEGALVALVQDAGEPLVGLIQAVQTAGSRVVGVEIAEPNLEAVFLHLTGRALRD